MKMKLLCLLSAFVALPSLRAQEPTVLYGDWSEKGKFKWTDAAGNPVDAWQDGSIAYVDRQYNGNVGGGEFNAYGFVFAYGNCLGYWTDNGKRSVGAGGIAFLSDGTYACGKNNFTTVLFALTASQEWKGPVGDGGNANLSVGYPGYGSYWKMPVKIGQEVASLGISGRLDVWLSSPSNDFSGVDVTVAAPARLYLPSSRISDSTEFDARLRAKTLTLSGEGAQMLPLGGNVTYFSSTSLKLGNLLSFDADHVAEEVVLEGGADVCAASPAYFAVPSLKIGAGESEISGNFVVTQELTRIELSGGAVLRLSGPFEEQGVDASVSVSGRGTLIVDSDNYRLGGALELGEEVDLHLVGKGKMDIAVSGGKSLRVSGKDGGVYYIPSSALAGMTSLSVTAGDILLESRMEGLALAVEEGASVVYGEDDAYVVTDTPRSERTIALDGTRPLEIYGNGLTEQTTLVFSKGTNLVFRSSAVVSSPIQISAGDYQDVKCLSDALADATLAGKIENLQKKTNFVLSGPGNFVLSGGFNLGVEGSMIINDDANVVLTGNHEYTIPGFGSLIVGSKNGRSDAWGRSLTVRDGAHLRIKDAASTDRHMFMLQPVKNSEYDSSCTVEAATGGTITFPGKGSIFIGGNQSVGKLVVSGGTVNVGANSKFCIGYGQYATGYLHMNAGRLNLGSPFTILEPSDTSFVKWNGGTIAIAENFSGKSLVDGVFSNGNQGSRRLSVEIAGDCTLDLAHSPYTVFTNMTDTTNRGEWYGKGSLTVKGGKTLLMRSMPDNIALRVEGDATAVAIDDETRIFNYEECVKNVIWRRPYPVANAEYSSAGAQTNALTLASFTVGGGCAGFANLSSGYEVAVPKASVAAGGEWNNAFAVRGAGITLGDLDFAAGSTLYAGIAGRVTPTLALSGALTLPDGEMFLRTSASARPSGNSAIVFAAAGGISGEPRWKSLSGRRNVFIEGNLLKLAFPGMDIFVR